MEPSTKHDAPLQGIEELLAVDLKARSTADRALTAWIAARGCRFYVRLEEPGKALQCAKLLYRFHDDKCRRIRKLVGDVEAMLNEEYGVA